MTEVLADTTPDPAAMVAAVLAEETRRAEEQAARTPKVSVSDELLPGVGGDASTMAEVLRAGGVSLVAVLTALVLVDSLSSSAFAVLGPDIERSLDMSDLQLGVVGALGGLVVFAAAIPLGYLGDRTRRTTLVGVCSVMWAGFVMLTGAVHAFWQLMIVSSAAGMAKANEQPVHAALLSDGYPIEGRNRVFGIHRAAQPLGGLLGPALAGGLATVLGGGSSWRWVFVILSAPAALLAFGAFGL